MTVNRIACAAFVAAALLANSQPASAEDAISHPAKKPIGSTQQQQQQVVPTLAVINARGASLAGNTLTLTGVGPNSIVFADRPVHAAGHVLTSHFIKEWDEGQDSFAKNPPNATISVLSNEGDAVKDAVVVLKSPQLNGDKLTFDVTVLEGDLAGASGAAALFIDHFAVRVGGGGWHGGDVVVGRGPAWHGAWYGRPGAAFAAGAAVGAIGAAAAAPYYGPTYYGPGPYCGYYPYPPCY